jgi:DNA-binding PadR family transcriptional regulator
MPSATRKRDAESFLPLTTASFHILLTLADGERHGYAIMQEVREDTGGKIRLGPGTLYRSLQALLDGELIEELARLINRDDDERRRYYRLTHLGRRVLTAESRRLADAVALARSKRILQRVPG